MNLSGITVYIDHHHICGLLALFERSIGDVKFVIRGTIPVPVHLLIFEAFWFCYSVPWSVLIHGVAMPYQSALASYKQTKKAMNTYAGPDSVHDMAWNQRVVQGIVVLFLVRSAYFTRSAWEI